MTDPLAIDPQAIDGLRALNSDDGDAFVRELRDIFFEDTPLRLNALDQSLASGDIAKFCRTAHTIKGSSSNFGAVALRNLAQEMETKSKTSLPPELAAMVAQLKTEYARAKAEISRLIP